MKNTWWVEEIRFESAIGAESCGGKISAKKWQWWLMRKETIQFHTSSKISAKSGKKGAIPFSLISREPFVNEYAKMNESANKTLLCLILLSDFVSPKIPQKSLEIYWFWEESDYIMRNDHATGEKAIKVLWFDAGVSHVWNDFVFSCGFQKSPTEYGLLFHRISRGT